MGDRALLQFALDAQVLRDDGRGLTDKVADQIKQSTILQYNWQDLLQSCPVAMSAAAACNIAGFSSAGRMPLSKPASGSFKYLE